LLDRLDGGVFCRLAAALSIESERGSAAYPCLAALGRLRLLLLSRLTLPACAAANAAPHNKIAVSAPRPPRYSISLSSIYLAGLRFVLESVGLSRAPISI